MADPAVRIVAKSASNHTHETVNIVTAQPTKPMPYKKHVQATPSQAAAAKLKTLQDSGGTVKGLRTIHVPGYSAPN